MKMKNTSLIIVSLLLALNMNTTLAITKPKTTQKKVVVKKKVTKKSVKKASVVKPTIKKITTSNSNKTVKKSTIIQKNLTNNTVKVNQNSSKVVTKKVENKDSILAHYKEVWQQYDEDKGSPMKTSWGKAYQMTVDLQVQNLSDNYKNLMINIYNNIVANNGDLSEGNGELLSKINEYKTWADTQNNLCDREKQLFQDDENKLVPIIQAYLDRVNGKIDMKQWAEIITDKNNDFLGNFYKIYYFGNYDMMIKKAEIAVQQSKGKLPTTWVKK